MTVTLEQMKRSNENNGYHWFKPETMRYFRTRISETSITEICDGALFVTSEQSPYDVRKYSVRKWTRKTGTVETYGEFCGYTTLKQAIRALREIVPSLV